MHNLYNMKHAWTPAHGFIVFGAKLVKNARDSANYSSFL